MKEKSARRLWWLAALAVGLGLGFAPVPEVRGAHANSSLAVRLFGPIAALAASAEWVRADLALQDGRVELFLARAQTALSLAPDAPYGWHQLAWDEAFTLASPEHEPDPARRLSWINAALATAAEGERTSSSPGELAFVAGSILHKVVQLDPELPWPGGLAAILEAEALHFERAEALGFEKPMASMMKDWARRQALAARAGH